MTSRRDNLYKDHLWNIESIKVFETMPAMVRKHSRRGLATLLIDQGVNEYEIATRLGVKPSWVNKLIAQQKKGGPMLYRFDNRVGNGRKPILNDHAVAHQLAHQFGNIYREGRAPIPKHLAPFLTEMLGVRVSAKRAWKISRLALALSKGQRPPIPVSKKKTLIHNHLIAAEDLLESRKNPNKNNRSGFFAV